MTGNPGNARRQALSRLTVDWHRSVICPECPYRESFGTTLARHGLPWLG